MEKELEAAKYIAREAGRVLLEYYAHDERVVWKGYDDPVTAADRAADELIGRALRRHFPADAVLSEEAADDLARLGKERVWLVDPMDGTKQFIERRGEFAVQIGLAIDGEARLGVVYQPTTDRMLYAAPGLGAFVEEKWSTKRLQVAAPADPAQMIAAVSRSHNSTRTDQMLARLGVTRRWQSGSVGLKFGLIADGSAHLYIHTSGRTNQWDTCGPEAILRAAGGVVTDLYGAPLVYNRPEVRNQSGVIACAEPLHERILAAAAEVLGERH